MCPNFQSKWTTLNFSVYILGNSPIRCNIIVLITLRVLHSWVDNKKSWVEVDGARWRLKLNMVGILMMSKKFSTVGLLKIKALWHFTQWLTSFSSIDHILRSLCMFFDSISCNIDEVLSINPSANLFVFGDINVHHKDWLTYSSETDRPGKLCYNFSISNYLLLLKLTFFLSQIPDCDYHSPALLDFFLSSSICSTMTFPPLENSDHTAVSVSLTFHQIHNEMPHFIT